MLCCSHDLVLANPTPLFVLHIRISALLILETVVLQLICFSKPDELEKFKQILVVLSLQLMLPCSVLVMLCFLQIQHLCSLCRDKNPTPPGGFTNFMQPHLSQNFHFVGGAAQFAPFKVPRAKEDTPIEEEFSTPRPSIENDSCVNVESDDEVVEVPRTEKRILYTQEEDVRMVSVVHLHGNYVYLLTFSIQVM
jgi:hypothetical protein